MGVTLKDLLKEVSVISVRGSTSDEVEEIVVDSRNVKPCTLFVAIRGSGRDGHDFLSSVVQVEGLIGVVVEDESRVPSNFSGAVIVVESARLAAVELASRIYGYPSEALRMIGVTGTNGKTTTTHMIEHLCRQFGFATGVMGTIDHHLQTHLGTRVWPSSLTTPGPIELQARLSDFLKEGAWACAMEVSSHALDQERADGVEFDGAVFTNLTRDHLDYHGTMEKYFEAKQRLFLDLLRKTKKPTPFAVLNFDDPMGEKIKTDARVRVISYGIFQGQLRAQIVAADFSGYTLNIQWAGHTEQMNLPMIGRFNISNALASIGCMIGLASQLSRTEREVLQHACAAFSDFRFVRGRLERVSNSCDLHIFVDYAHTDDALTNVLETLREVRKSSPVRIICVFGCGGDRDRGKRPLMGEVAARLADLVIVTSDNPRTEDPNRIIDEIMAGVSTSDSKGHVAREVDRARAIQKAISMANRGDVIVIAGKGHEDYQIIGDVKFHFDDVEIVQEALKSRNVAEGKR